MAVAALLIVVLILLIFSRTGEDDRVTIVIASESASAYYNGKPVTDDNYKIVEGSLKDGHKLSVTVSGSQTNVGISENTIEAVVKNRAGDDVSDEYNIVYRPGALTVKAKKLTIVADDAMKRYDGKPLVANSYTVENPSVLIDGARILVKFSSSITDVGTIPNVISSVTIVDASGKDITANYNIKKKNGELRVYSQGALIIMSESDQKYFDSNPLKNDKWYLVSGELLPGDQLVVSVVGEATLPGSKKNEFFVDIIDSNGEYVTDYYDIVKIYGDLIVLRP